MVCVHSTRCSASQHCSRGCITSHQRRIYFLGQAFHSAKSSLPSLSTSIVPNSSRTTLLPSRVRVPFFFPGLLCCLTKSGIFRKGPFLIVSVNSTWLTPPSPLRSNAFHVVSKSFQGKACSNSKFCFCKSICIK